MTCAIVPDFILQLFEKEIIKVVDGVVNKLCEEYSLDIQEVRERLKETLDINLHVVDSDIEQMKIVKKHQHASTSKSESSEHCCEARLFIHNELVVRQCSRGKMENSRFCKTHQKQFDSNTLKWGTIHDEKPEEISTAKLKHKVKKTLY